MKIAVTGISGFVASGLIPQLAKQHHVLGLSSKDNVRSEIKNVEYAKFSLLDKNDNINQLFDGIDVVIHLAAKVHDISNKQALDEYLNINVEGTRKLLDAAKFAKVNRFIYLSSIKVHGEKTGHNNFLTEDSPLAPLDPYSISKKQCEDLIRSYCSENNIEYVILRPPLIYGAGVKANFLKLMQLIDKTYPLPLALIHNKRSFVYLENLSDVIAICLEHENARNQTFVLKDYDLSTTELIRVIAKAMDKKTHLFPVPVFLLKTLGVLTGKKNRVDRLTDSLQIDNSKLKTLLSWQPSKTLEESISNTVHWYQHNS